jgi:hypothetical protein
MNANSSSLIRVILASAGKTAAGDSNERVMVPVRATL